MAKGAAQAISAWGIKVPEDLIIISATNSGIPLFYPIPIIAMNMIQKKSSVLHANSFLIRLQAKILNHRLLLTESFNKHRTIP